MMGKSKIKIEKSKFAFTLVEILVATAIFMVLITIGIVSFATIVNWKKRTSANNTLQEVGRHAMEVIVKDVERADLTKSKTVDTVIYYGFRFPADQLEIFSPDVTYGRDGTTIKKNNYALTPSNVDVTELTFTGFGKTAENVTSADYQQPYVTISMTLETQVINPATGATETKTAQFKTTARPQPVELMGYAEVQAGEGDGGSNVFPLTFSKSPTVITARKQMNEDDDQTRVANMTPSGFSAGTSVGGGFYYIAINGEFPNLVKTGKVYAGDPANDCSDHRALCVSYTSPFPSGTLPVSLVMRGYTTNDELKMNYTVRNSSSNSQLTIAGDGWYDYHDSYNNQVRPEPWSYPFPITTLPIHWISINPELKQILSPTGIVFNSGYQRVFDKTLADGNFDCQECSFSYQPNPLLPPETIIQHMCNFRTASIIPGYPAAKKTFSTVLPSIPKVIISVAGNNGKIVYPTSGSGTKNLGTPGVVSVDTGKFVFTNTGNGVNDYAACSSMFKDSYYTSSEKTSITNLYGLNWVAVNQNFKLKWSYDQ